jgi:rod shape-determining protein MreD
MSGRGTSRWPIWLVMLTTLALTSLPLPDGLTPFRPPWVTLAVIYWVMMSPRKFGIGSAWLVGLLLDVLLGDLLGQNALALSVVSYLTLRFHLQIRIFPLWQLTMTVFALLAIDAFLVFWIDGIIGNPLTGIARWTQVIVGAVLWAPFMAIMDRIREQTERRSATFT